MVIIHVHNLTLRQKKGALPVEESGVNTSRSPQHINDCKSTSDLITWQLFCWVRTLRPTHGKCPPNINCSSLCTLTARVALPLSQIKQRLAACLAGRVTEHTSAVSRAKGVLKTASCCSSLLPVADCACAGLRSRVPGSRSSNGLGLAQAFTAPDYSSLPLECCSG